MRFNFLYLGRPPWDTGVSPPELNEFLLSAEPGSALDVGCGTGTNLRTLAEHGWEVVGVDFAWLSVVRARVKLWRAGFNGRVIHGDVTGNLNLKTSFDCVLDIGCYHSLSNNRRMDYRQNLRKWLNEGGTFMLYAHQRASAEDMHGISEQDIGAFESFLAIHWREDSNEERPDGGGGRPATWIRFDRKRVQ